MCCCLDAPLPYCGLQSACCVIQLAALVGVRKNCHVAIHSILCCKGVSCCVADHSV